MTGTPFTLREVGEVAAIRRLTSTLSPGAGVVVGVGDDCAVVRPAPDAAVDWLLTSDPVVEGVHFDAGTPAEAIGHKAVGRVLSDLAAMGGRPRWALIDVTAPPRTPMARLEGVYVGADRIAAACGLAIVGGDLGRGSVLALHVFAVGQVPAGSALVRSGARPGDRVFVTGELGGSRCGRHLSFEPRLPHGSWLSEGRWATAAIDLSDGLARDIGHVLRASGVGAELDLNAIPVSQAARALCDGRSPIEHALYDGEDFELLFTASADREAELQSEWAARFGLRCTRIGLITGESGVLRRSGTPPSIIPEEGYEHFGEDSAAGTGLDGIS
jgi:thiamine-monophosphate kinase